MAAKPLRLLHAANLRLDCPLKQFGEFGDDLQEILDSATLTAFDRLVSLAIDRDVDAVLITGNSFDAAASSLPAEVALRHGFDRLHERGIPVFATPGIRDPASAWEDFPALPDNVTVFFDPNEPAVDLTDHGRLLATLFPVTFDTPVEPHELDNLYAARAGQHSDRPFVVGLALPQQASSRMGKNAAFAALDFLACAAGDQTLTDLPLTDGTIHAQDGPQGLSIAETGPRGVTLLEVDSQRRVKQTLIPLCPVRWEQLTQSIDRIRDRDDLAERMLGALERIPAAAGELVRIVHWKLERTLDATHGLEMPSAIQELTELLTQMTQHSGGLRYIHQIRSVDPDLSMIDSAHRELATEFLLALNARVPVERVGMNKWLAEAHLGETLKTKRWEHWPDAVDPATIGDRAQQLGWQWFMSIGKK